MAYEDACFDHAGDGILAAQFLARMQSMAFVRDDLRGIVLDAAAAMPTESRLRTVVDEVVGWVDQGRSWTDIRTLVMERHGNDDFTDVRPNTAWVVTGLLCGTDFSWRILITNNCGEDCDSSTASVGALLGILDPASIDHKWLAPIGRDLVLNDGVVDLDHPTTLDGFTDLVVDLAQRLDEQIGPDPAQVAAEADAFDPDEHAFTIKQASGTPTGSSGPAVTSAACHAPARPAPNSTWSRPPSVGGGTGCRPASGTTGC